MIRGARGRFVGNDPAVGHQRFVAAPRDYASLVENYRRMHGEPMPQRLRNEIVMQRLMSAVHPREIP